MTGGNMSLAEALAQPDGADIDFEPPRLPRFEACILAVDVAVAQRCASLHVPDPRAERDALIAATAMVHGLTLVTRNAADFEPTGVPLLDPWRPGQPAQ
jgi:predicted nucleic acid-binding protein